MKYMSMIKPTKHSGKGKYYKKKWLGKCCVCGLDDGLPKGLATFRVNIFRGDDEVRNCCVTHKRKDIEAWLRT